MKKIYYPMIITAAAILVTSNVPANYAHAASLTTLSQPYVADTAMYRGVVTNFYFNEEGNTEVTLNQAEGTNYGLPTITFLVNSKTKTSFDINKVELGMYLEIYYGSLTNNSVKAPEDAISVHKLNDVLACNYNGTVVEVMPEKDKDGTGSILLKDENGMETIFHYYDETQLYLDIADIKPGDKLNVYHKGIMTRSIPPQGSALEIRKQNENIVYRGNVTSVKTTKDVTTVQMKRAAGSPHSKITVIVTIDKNTKSGVTPSEIKKGMYLEVYYTQSKKTPHAVSVKQLMESKAVNYNGVVVSINPDPEREGYGTILMAELTGDKNDPNQQTYFHYSPNVTFNVSLEKIKKGTKLNIYHQGISLQSLPPQCIAMEISSYVK